MSSNESAQAASHIFSAAREHASQLTSNHDLGSIGLTVATWLRNANLGSTLVAVIKGLGLILLLLNCRALPFVWTVRMMRWEFARVWANRFERLKTIIHPPRVRGKLEDKYHESLIPLGEHPYEYISRYTSIATLDECDFFMHMSNSSYPKTIDAARAKVGSVMLPLFAKAGGWYPLAATHFHFICEIPILASFEVRTRVGAWDGKWLYVVSKFVLPPGVSKKALNKAKSKARRTDGDISALTSTDTSMAATGVSTPYPTVARPATGDHAGSTGEDSLKVVDKLLAQAQAEVLEQEKDEPDGYQVHTVAISRICFKVGRITVPPTVVLALHGMSSETVPGAEEPPHWDKVRDTFARLTMKDGKMPSTGTFSDAQALAKFLKGGWKDVTDDKLKWWDRAFDSVRQENNERLQKLRLLVGGLNAAEKVGWRM
ncbi:hypothetical protein FA15DRAFT_669828 [Coprinopsis marcescibilis]|uniref:Thioesterase/thiol ester dehydrase-isomerase n=1 Tax=Coprinopsis marcescibilis TaxID=230819 RepID=A0A5C3KUE0_COPMA|nr:hypothetical protein FA15DRAFT_669828 [Coprinopsis marcescibilis]